MGMKEFLTSPITKNVARLALLLFVFLASLLFVYRISTYTYLTVEFNDARPMRNKIPVYYKGYRIGKVEKIKPCEDFKTTNVTIVLYPKGIRLPINTTAILTREKHGKNYETDFINLLYPDNPSDVVLRDGDTIIGVTTVDMDNFLASKAASGELDIITKNVNTLLENLQATSNALSELMGVLQDTVNENRPSMKEITVNLAEASNQFKLFTAKLNNSVNQQEIQSTFSSLSQSSINFSSTTKNIDALMESLNSSAPNIKSIITNTDKITSDIEAITSGLKCTMSKKFGGMRLLFGKSVNSGCSRKWD